jgi:hypothetical protein
MRIQRQGRGPRQATAEGVDMGSIADAGVYITENGTHPRSQGEPLWVEAADEGELMRTSRGR